MSKHSMSPAIAATFDGYPNDLRAKLLRLRELIFEVAAETPGVGTIEETLKWGEPAYLTTNTKSGSTVRIAWKKSKPDQYSMYFICTTNLVETFRSMFPSDFQYEGNRAINFRTEEAIPEDALRFCIAAALTHRLRSVKAKVHPPHAASEAYPSLKRSANGRRHKEPSGELCCIGDTTSQSTAWNNDPGAWDGEET